MPQVTLSEWDSFYSQFPEAHILQSSRWGELKSAFGWFVRRLIVPSHSDQAAPAQELGDKRSGVQVLFRRLPLGFSIAYIPKGPVGDDWVCLLPELDQLCRQQRAILLKVEPDAWQDELQPPPGFQQSSQSIQPPRTLVVDLRGGEADVLARMKQKARYNVRLALKKDVIVYPIQEVELFCRLMQSTGERDRFGVHSQAYYEKVYELFHARGECEMLLADFEGEPLAVLMVFARGKRAWYFYGGSVEAHRDRMPSYLLQWEAMRWARQQGCEEYDLWGVPDESEETLEAGFTDRSEGLWGVYRFKRGFGGKLRRTAGPWDRIYLPSLYRLYSYIAGRRGEGG